MTFSKEEISTLNIIRWSSVLMIFSCHILQGLNNKWAFVLNVGVQIFFFLSGFLYGTKGISNPKEFYIKRFTKVYIPYFITVSLFLLLQLILTHRKLQLIDVVGYYICINNILTAGIPGLGHLWFIPVIFICYLILPLFDYCICRKPMLTISAFVSLLGAMMYIKPHPYLLWIGVYYAGYISSKYPSLQKYIFGLSAVGCMFLLTTKYILHVSVLDSAFNPLMHASGGIFLFLAAFYILSYIHVNQLIISNLGGGYLIYLTHLPFIIGPLSVLHLTPYIALNIILIIMLTLVLSYVVNQLSRLMTGDY